MLIENDFRQPGLTLELDSQFSDEVQQRLLTAFKQAATIADDCTFICVGAEKSFTAIRQKEIIAGEFVTRGWKLAFDLPTGLVSWLELLNLLRAKSPPPDGFAVANLKVPR